VRHTQCLFYALDQWHQDGGYLMLRRSAHWCIPHVLHMSADGVLTHFTPDADLVHPVASLFGFDGNVRTQDATAARPMGMLCMGAGTVLLVLLGTVWVARTGVRLLYRPWMRLMVCLMPWHQPWVDRAAWSVLMRQYFLLARVQYRHSLEVI